MEVYKINMSPEQKMSLARAMHAIKSFPETKPFYDRLKEMMAESDKANRLEGDDVYMRQRQGICQALETLILGMDNARDDFESFDSQRRAV